MKTKVLVVEDYAPQRRVIIAAFSHFPLFEVREAENGQEAWEALMEFHAHLIITDTHMPIMDGPALIKRAKDLYPDIRAILMSGDDVKELAQECGADATLKKPFRLPALLELVKKLFEI